MYLNVIRLSMILRLMSDLFQENKSYGVKTHLHSSSDVHHCMSQVTSGTYGLSNTDTKCYKNRKDYLENVQHIICRAGQFAETKYKEIFACFTKQRCLCFSTEFINLHCSSGQFFHQTEREQLQPRQFFSPFSICSHGFDNNLFIGEENPYG